jgi:hypothetical protein
MSRPPRSGTSTTTTVGVFKYLGEFASASLLRADLRAQIATRLMEPMAQSDERIHGVILKVVGIM